MRCILSVCLSVVYPVCAVNPRMKSHRKFIIGVSWHAELALPFGVKWFRV